MPSGVYTRTKPNHWIGKKHSKESIHKMSLSKKGKHYSAKTEFKIGQKAWNKDKKYPEFSRDKSHSWKGGEYASNGYIYVLTPNHPFANKAGYVKRCRLIMEKHIGRYLLPKEVIHHINGIKTDDRIKNLYLCANTSEHSKIHYPKGSMFGVHCTKPSF